MATNLPDLKEFLTQINLAQYHEKFVEAGVETSEDLIDCTKYILKNEVGMKKLAEINRLLRKVQEMFPRTATPSIYNPTQDLYEIEKKRANLQISYRLFTEFQPPTDTLGPFKSLSTLLYCDLVSMICNEQRQWLGPDLTVELYTCEGYPMACKPVCYIRKVSEWCLEDYPGIPLLYAIPRLKNYSEQCEITATPLQQGKDVIYIANKQYSLNPIRIDLDCSNSTYPQLIRYISEKTGIPAKIIHLRKGNQLIYCDTFTNKKLSDLDITNQAALTLKLDEEFWPQDKNASCTYSVCKPVWQHEQSDYGKTFFYGCLFVLSSWMSHYDQELKKLQTLGHLRSLTDCPPLIHSLMVLFSHKTLTLPHRVAIQEILMVLFRTIKPKAKKGNVNGITIQDSDVTNYSNIFWAYFIEKSTRIHANTELYETFELINPNTSDRLKDPVLVRDPQGKEHVVDRLNQDKDAMQINSMLNYKRMLISFREDNPKIWKCTSIHSCSVDLTSEWNNIKKILKKIKVLCVQAPLNVKSHACPKPGLIPVEGRLLGVYCDINKVNDEFIYLNPLNGYTKNFDCEQLDTVVKIKENQPLCFKDIIPTGGAVGVQTITREPEEIIMVLLDTSGSMDEPYFEGVSKYNSVVQGFSSFSDRTYAYGCPHLIGLTSFTNNSTLNYPLAENFRQFLTQFSLQPPGNCTAVYDAIQFAVKNLNAFYISHPEYAHVPRRILCLTDGADNSSKITSKKAAQLLIDNNIIMDSVVLCQGQMATHLITKASGGYSFQPNNSSEFVNIFQLEVMLMMKMRKYRHSFYARGQEINLDVFKTTPCDKDPEVLFPEKLFKKAQTPQKCLTRAQIQKRLNTETNSDVTKRILKELAYYQHNPHPSIEVFPCEESVDFWQIILKGPEDSPYDGRMLNEIHDEDKEPDLGKFHLYAEFSNEYPVKPPNIRFCTPIYHCNINSAGRICHTILDRFYVPGIRIKEIFDHIYGLLLDPAPDDPLDSVKADELRYNRELYLQKARDCTLKNTHTITDLRFKILQTNEKDMVNAFPTHLVCPLTMQLFDDPVITIHGETYEREAIIDHLKSGKYYDPFSYKELKETDPLIPNRAIKVNVEEYKENMKNSGLL